MSHANGAVVRIDDLRAPVLNAGQRAALEYVASLEIDLSEAGLLPNSEVLHAATEKFSPGGLYGKWFSLVMISVCALWLLIGWLKDRLKLNHRNEVSLGQT